MTININEVPTSIPTVSGDALVAQVETARDQAQTAAANAAEILSMVWSPRDLLADGARGAQTMPFDPALGNVWTDTARSAAATAPGQRIASARVATESGFLYAEQATLNDRPYLGRVPFGGRRNLLQNTAIADSVAGTPGTLPNSWSVSGGTDITTSVVATGTDGDGIPYLDLRIQGSPGSNLVINFSGTTDVPIVGGETYTWSLKAGIVGGSTTNVTNINQQIGWRTAAGSLLQSAVSAEQLKGYTEADFRSFTAAAPTGLASPVERMNAQIRVTGSGAVDFTLRLGGTQFEVGSARTQWQRVTRLPGVPGSLDVTEAGKTDVWYLWKSDSSDSLPVTLPDLGSDATVARNELGAEALTSGVTVGAGAYQLLGEVGSGLVGLSIVSRSLSAAETAAIETWMIVQKESVATAEFEAPSGAVSLYDLGYTPASGDVRDLVAAALAVSPSGEVIIPFNTAPWVQGGQWIIPAGKTVTWEIGARVAQNHAANPGVILNEGVTLNRPYFTSTTYNQVTMVGLTRAANTTTHGLGRRQIRVDGPNVRILDVQMLEYMAGGILCDQPGLVVTGLRAQHLRSIQGWGGAIDLKNGCRDFYIEVDRISDCDRALEPEDGASHGRFVGKPGIIERVWSRWDDASDGTPEENFCISAHSHIDAEYDICKSIHYENFTVVDCVNPVLFTRSNATDDKMPQGCTAKGITVVNTDAFPASRQGSAPQVRIEGNGCEVEVSFVNERAAGVHGTLRGLVARGKGNRLRMMNNDGVAAIPWLSVASTAEGSIVKLSAVAVVDQPSAPGDPSQSHLIDVDGPGTEVHAQVHGVQHRGYIRLAGTAGGSRVVNPDFVMPTENAANAAVRFNAASGCSILGGRYSSPAGLSQLARFVQMSQRNIISGVVADTSGSFATLDAPNAMGNLIAGNSFGAAIITGGSGNTVSNNV